MLDKEQIVTKKAIMLMVMAVYIFHFDQVNKVNRFIPGLLYPLEELCYF